MRLRLVPHQAGQSKEDSGDGQAAELVVFAESCVFVFTALSFVRCSLLLLYPSADLHGYEAWIVQNRNRPPMSIQRS